MLNLTSLLARGFGENARTPDISHPKPKVLNLSFAPMEGRHIQQVARIESSTRLHAWTETRFKALATKDRTHANVAILDDWRVASYLIHESDGGVIRIVNFGTDPTLERQGIAGRMVDELVRRATESGRTLIACRLPERFLAAQKFLGKHGFSVEMPGGIEAPAKGSREGGDVYVFTLRLSGGECWGR